MTPGQIAKVPAKQQEAADQLRDLLQSALNGDRSPAAFEALRVKMLAIQHDTAASILDAAQMKRFEELDLQRQGPSALLRPDVAAKLNLTDGQRKQLTTLRREASRAMRESRRGGDGQNNADADTSGMNDAERQSSEKMLAVLTADQLAQWKALQGDPMPNVRGITVRTDVNIRPVTPLNTARPKALEPYGPGSTPLMRAASAGDLDEVKSLIAADNRVDAKNKEGRTALMFAASNGRKDCVACLIAAHADANAKDKKGDTVLIAAARGGDPDCVKAILAAGADLKATDNEGVSALMSAAQYGKAPIVGYLIGAGAAVNAKNKDGETSLVRAVCVTWDQSRTPPPGVQVPGFTYLNPAGSPLSNQAATASQITALGSVAGQVIANSLFPGPMVKFPVGWGAGDLATVKSLIAAGADVNCKDALYHMTPLIAGAMRRNGDCVNALIAAGADVNAKDGTGQTALIWASSNGAADCVNALIAAHSDVNVKNNGGRTALMDAANRDHPECVKALVAASSDVKARDRRGKTARALATSDEVRSILDAAEPK